MALSPFLRNLRAKVGHDLLVLPSAVGFVLDGESRVLSVRHAVGGQWTFPGGCVEPDETPQCAVVREVEEETGLLVRPGEVIAVSGGPDFRIEYPNGDVVSYVAALFECRVEGGSLQPDGREVLQAEFFHLDRLEALNLSRIGRAHLDAALQHPRFANRLAKPS